MIREPVNTDTDADDDVGRFRDPGIGDVLESDPAVGAERLVILVQDLCLHGALSRSGRNARIVFGRCCTRRAIRENRSMSMC